MQVPPTLLLTTKLYRPRIDDNWVSRPHLLARLNAGVRHKLILLSAPPGFGKSTLVSQWLNQLRLPIPAFGLNTGDTDASQHWQSCWLSLDEGDNQLVQFLRYLMMAVRTCEPAACPTTQSLLDAGQLPGVDYLADSVVSELSALADELVIVLDDYHLIRSDEVHQVMRHLLRYMPPRLHLVILSRTDPPLHLGRLRIEQQITELRASDLRFAVAETRRFLHDRLDQSLDDATLNLLHARTEGWITALQLSSIALQRQDPRQFLDHFRGNDRLLVGYLVEEVMEHLAEPVRDFLLRTAIVDRFTAPLADALLATPQPAVSSQALIAQLEAQNLFIIPLDQVGEWMRYHDLFRDFLRHELKRAASPAHLAWLHQRASAWYAEHGLIEEALHHALAAGNTTSAADLVEAQFHSLLNRQVPMYTLVRWLNYFPPETIQAHAGLLLVQAHLPALGMAPPVSAQHFTHIERLLQADTALSSARRTSHQADLDLLRGIAAYAKGEPQQAIYHLEQAAATLPVAHEFSRAQAKLYLAVVYACLGQPAVGHTLLQSALVEATQQEQPTQMILLGGVATLQLYAAEFPALAQTTQRILRLVETLQRRPTWQGVGFVDIWRGRAHYFQGVVAYEHNELDQANYHWHMVESLRYRTHPAPYHDSLIGLALVAQAQGLPGEAWAYAQAAREFAEEIHNPWLVTKSAALEVRLTLLANQTAEAMRRAEEFTIPANQGSAFGLTLPVLVRVTTLLTEASPTSLVLGLHLTETCLEHAQNMHNAHSMIQVLSLQALTLQALARREAAYAALARLLALAEPGGFVRQFLDLGAPMENLLRAFAATQGQPAYVKRLLALFPQPPDPAERRALTSQYAKIHGITPLTAREIELLTLIRQRLSIEEIAATLVISPNTVKKHANNIYTKLGVRNRREALAKAVELTLLPPA